MIQASALNFVSSMENCNSTQAESTLTVNELKGVFFPFTINKSPGYDESVSSKRLFFRRA